MKEKIIRIAALVAALLLLVILVGGLIYTCVVSNKWPVYVFLCILLVFGWDNIYGTFKWLLEVAMKK